MQYQQAPIPAAAAAPASTPFQLEEALFSSAPVGLHCINSSGIILWANKMELTLLGFTREQYVGQQVESLVYMDLEKVDSNSYLANTAISNQLQLQQQQQQQLGSNSNTAATSNNQQQQQAVNFVNDRSLYKEVLKQITSGHAVHDIPIRFVTYSGNVLHLILDCDAVPLVLHHTRSANNSSVVTEEIYYRCFTRDDTARRIQEMRSNVLFQETNRSLQMLDNFMNRSMTQMRLPLALMERACNLVAENIEDIDEVISAQANAMIPNTIIPPPAAAISSLKQTQQQMGSDRKRPAVVMRPLSTNLAGNRQAMTAATTTTATTANHLAFGNINTNFSPPLAVALSATSEARSVVGLASRIVDDALALVDDITDLCRFDQGQVLVVDKEAVKLREVCIEALNRVPIPLGSRGVEVLLDIQTGTPARAMADRSVLQRILALLMNFAVDAAANAVSKSTESQVTGKVILSISDAALYQAEGNGSASSCKISVFYTNPPDSENVEAMASMSIDDSSSVFVQTDEGDNVFSSGTGRGGSMTRRSRLRENIERGMTSYQREKLGLGLSLVHHLVSAHGSDLRYEIVADETMTKFWFLLPMSLDFPERLNAERMLKDNMQGYNYMQASVSRPLKRPKVAESMSVPTVADPQFMPELSATPTSLCPAITSQAASGSNAVATLPNADETTKSTEPKQPRQYPGVEPGARPLVLVVEDTDVSASLLCMHLRKLNCTSHRAENGEVALEMLRSAPDPSMYSLVLMDLRMPVMDGFEAAEVIRGSIATNIPIVALTGETSELHKRKCEEIGFDAFETKPLKRPQLKELLNKLVPGYQAPPE